MELKHTVKTTIYVDYFDLARYLSDKIGRDVEIGDSNNDTDYSVALERGELSDWDMNYVNAFLNKGWISMELGYRAVLNYCVNQGWLDEGDYVIEVSW